MAVKEAVLFAQEIMKSKYIITGEYGSGKTEFSINLGLTLKRELELPIYIADLDVINPYFRSRKKGLVLKEKGIELVGYSTTGCYDQDIPGISYGFIQETGPKKVVIIDLAGSENGLKPLEALYDKIKPPEFLAVINLFRPLTSTKEDIIGFLNKINKISSWSLTGLVNNSNMLSETDSSHILRGQEILLSVSEELGLPLKFTQLQRGIYEQVSHQIRSEQVILFEELQMREQWQ